MQYYTAVEPRGPWTWMWASLQIREKVKMPPHVIELAGEGSRRALEFDLSAQFPSLRWRKKCVVLFFLLLFSFAVCFESFFVGAAERLERWCVLLRLEAWNSFSMFQSDFSLVWTVDKTTPKSRYCLAWRKLALTRNCRVLIKSVLYSPVAARYNFTLKSCWTFWWLINFCRAVREEKNSFTFFEI